MSNKKGVDTRFDYYKILQDYRLMLFESLLKI